MIVVVPADSCIDLHPHLRPLQHTHRNESSVLHLAATQVPIDLNKWGLTNATAGAHLIASQIEDQTLPDWAPVMNSNRLGLSGLSDVVSANANVAAHLGAAVAWNPTESTWDCPLHGSRFARTGEMLHGPAVDDLDRP